MAIARFSFSRGGGAAFVERPQTNSLDVLDRKNIRTVDLSEEVLRALRRATAEFKYDRRDDLMED
jgi:hypothetical protein